MAIHMGKAAYLDLGGYDLSSFIADSQATPGQLALLEALPDASATISGYWDAPMPGLTECSMTFVVPGWMLEPRYRKAIALFLDPVGYHRRRRMRTAYHRRRR